MKFEVDVIDTTKVRSINSLSHTARIDIKGAEMGIIVLNLSPKLFDLFDRSMNHKGTLTCEFTIQENS